MRDNWLVKFFVSFGAAGVIAGILSSLACIYGYWMNIYYIVAYIDILPDRLLVLRIIGIIVGPLGVFLGFIHP